jgi:hypothetical protein
VQWVIGGNWMVGGLGSWRRSKEIFFFFFFCQILCKIYGEEICKILTIKNKNKIKENEKFTRPLDRTLALAYSYDTMKENIIKWKIKTNSGNNKIKNKEKNKNTMNFTWFGL